MTKHPILFSGPMVRAILDGRKTVTRRIVKPQPIPIPPDDEFSPYSKWHPSGFWWQCHAGQTMLSIAEMCDFGAGPYGGKGSRLWVRETWASAYSNGCWGTIFAADGAYVQGKRQHPKGPHFNADDRPLIKFKPSIHMPRWASRLLLDVVSVRVERLQDITEEDAKAEGALYAIDEEQTVLNPELTDSRNIGCCACRGDPRGISELCHPNLRGKGRPHACWFATLWDSINGKRNDGAYRWASNPWVWRVEFRRANP